MNLEVTSVEKNRQKLSKTPAAVFVITQEDIRRSGATSLPEVLRMAPGVSVARIGGSQWAVGVRGFNNLYSNKLLVMIDGRTIYNALMSGVLWSENLVMLEDIERIEVIRGPGATMWGANAVSGVINIITKSATATTGGMAAVSGGTFDHARARVRYGRSMGDNSAWRGWAQYTLQGQATFPGLPSLDDWRTARGGMRVDWKIGPQDSLFAEGEVQTSNPQVLQNDAGSLARVMDAGSTSGYLMGRWDHTTRRGDTLSVQASESDDSLNAGVFSARVRSIDLDIQDTIHLGSRHSLIFGGGARANMIETKGTSAFSFDPANRTYYMANGFVADEWTLRPDILTLSLGTKLEDYTRAGFTVQPTARLMWTPTAWQGYWVSGSRAVRTAAHTDYAIRVSLLIPGVALPIDVRGNEQFQPEVLNAFEAGARFQVHRKLGIDIAAFRHAYDGLYAYRLGAPTLAGGSVYPGLPALVIPAITANGLDGTNQGVEVALHYDIRRGLDVSGSYSSLFVSTTYRPGLSAANTFTFADNTPEHQFQVRSSWDFARKWKADAALYWTGSLPGGALPAYSRLNCRIARSIGEFAEFSVSGENLLRPYQQEFAGNVFYPAGLVPRSVDVGLRWNF